MSMKNPNDNIGNRTRDLPVCSAVPQPNAPPRTPCMICTPCQHYSGDHIKKNETSWACNKYGKPRSEYRALVGKP